MRHCGRHRVVVGQHRHLGVGESPAHCGNEPLEVDGGDDIIARERCCQHQIAHNVGDVVGIGSDVGLRCAGDGQQPLAESMDRRHGGRINVGESGNKALVACPPVIRAARQQQLIDRVTIGWRCGSRICHHGGVIEQSDPTSDATTQPAPQFGRGRLGERDGAEFTCCDTSIGDGVHRQRREGERLAGSRRRLDHGEPRCGHHRDIERCCRHCVTSVPVRAVTSTASISGRYTCAISS